MRFVSHGSELRCGVGSAKVYSLAKCDCLIICGLREEGPRLVTDGGGVFFYFGISLCFNTWICYARIFFINS